MSAWNRLLKSCCVLVVLLIGLNTASSQGRIAAYSVTNFSGGFSSIVNAGSVWYNYNVWTQVTGMTLPFNFPFDNATINAGTTIYATSSGSLALSSTYPINFYQTAQANQTYPSLLSFMGGYLSTGSRHNGLYDNWYATQGVSPNRVFIVEFRNVHFQCANNWQNNYSINVQVKLYETTGVIEYLYEQNGRYMNSNCWSLPSIGINGRTSPSFSSKTVSSNVSTSPSQNLRFTPPPPPAQLSVQPKLLAFGNVTAGSPTVLCATVKSVGPAPLVINSGSISGTADYTILSGPAPNTVLASGASTTYCIQFNPQASGSRTAILTIVSTGADSGTQSVNLTGIGVAPGIAVPITEFFRKTKITVGDSAFAAVPFQSTGTGPLTITSVQIASGNTDQYVIKSFPTAPIPIGGWDTIHIMYKPTFQGRHDAVIWINNNSINAPRVTLRTVGTAIMPRLAITPLRLDFDSVFLGETVCREVTLYNPGTDTVNVLRVIQTFSDRDFSFTPLSSADTMILPEQTKVYRVCFSPVNVGTRLASVRFYSDIGRTIPDGRDTSQFILDIIGVGVPYGSLALSGSVVDSAVIGFQNCVTDMIRNVGTAPVTIFSASLSGVDAAEYSVSGMTFPMTLAAGESRPVTYCLTPTARGTRTASLVLTTSSEGQSTNAVLPLNGVGLLVCASSDRTTAFDDAMTAVGTTATATITVTNCGDVATAYTATPNWTVGPYTLVNGSTPVVPPGGTTTFEITYTPSAIGASTAAISVVGNGVGSIPFTINLGGVGAGVAASATGGNAGDVKVNECEDFTVTVRNDGNVDWTPGTPAFAGANAADFTFVSLAPETIAAGSTGTMTLRYCPTTLGNSTATLSFPAANPLPVSNFAYGVSGNGTPAASVSSATASKGFVLGQNYPNPLAISASFSVMIPKEAMVRIDLFDLTGAFVRNIANERMSGERMITVDAATLASGTYSYVLTSEDVRLVRQLSIVR